MRQSTAGSRSRQSQPAVAVAVAVGVGEREREGERAREGERERGWGGSLGESVLFLRENRNLNKHKRFKKGSDSSLFCFYPVQTI